jgi:hypothetical protein
MIPSYSLSNIPQDIPPFVSLAGQDDCANGYGDVFVNYFDEDTGYPIELVDTGNAYLASGYGMGGSIILKKSMTDREYIEYLYSLRDYNWSMSLGYSVSSGEPDSSWYRSSSFNIGLNFSVYPIFDNHSGSPTFNTADYLAPPARCLLQNSINQANYYNQSAYIHINSMSGIDEALTGVMTDSQYRSNKIYLLNNNWQYGNTLFFERVNIWERDYYSVDNYPYYFQYANTDAERAPFGFVGTGLALSMPTFHITVPYFYEPQSRYYHDIFKCNFATYFNNLDVTGGDAPWYFSFDGVDYQSYFNITGGIWGDSTTSASITTADSYFNFLDS